MENLNRTGHFEAIDVMKGIGICLVVAGHVISDALFALKFYQMPLFFMISGYLLNDQNNISDLLKKKIRTLYLPFIVYEIIFVILHNLLYSIGCLSVRYQIKDYLRALIHICMFDNYEVLLSPLWFLTALFFSTIIVRLFIEKFRDFRVNVFLSIFAIYIGILLGNSNALDIGFTKNFENIFATLIVTVGYTLAGYCCRQYIRQRKSDTLTSFNWKTVIGLVVIFLFMNIFERINSSETITYFADVRGGLYTYPLLAPIFAFVGVAVVYEAAYIICHFRDRLKGIRIITSNLGKASMSIMVLHPICFKIVGIVQVYLLGYSKENLADWNVVSSSYPWRLVYCFFGIVIPLVYDKMLGITKSTLIKRK